MALKTFVKISTVNNLSDARYCAGMYVNLMGFNLEEGNKDYMAPEKYQELTDWLSGLEYVGEFEASHPDTILETSKSYKGLSYLQVNEEALLQMLVNTSFKLILKQEIQSLGQLEDLKTKAHTYQENNVLLLLESANLEFNEDVSDLVKDIAKKCDVLLGFGLEADTVENVVNETAVKGIALKGGDEIKPGLKDFDELADILEALEEED
ncbi:phosphoribosylanthranilate isomerase [Echinicola vietnamensis]|uniref:phosphoribosylanthranilate isomerase n=1 Tax=Echinicola vietnamensis (strain DSM 17526 / LMG 23754 / KMM 6221) TaxID=926556 RepID=L0G0R7_ECHVK|nr:phosphoribosylanthranilate isomerase [Echinicola vietnamensis]AGA79794.1 phosphoribosylanthranilate isomerase [Echinicola vietnamensis DSM 17526]